MLYSSIDIKLPMSPPHFLHLWKLNSRDLLSHLIKEGKTRVEKDVFDEYNSFQTKTS